MFPQPPQAPLPVNLPNTGAPPIPQDFAGQAMQPQAAPNVHPAAQQIAAQFGQSLMQQAGSLQPGAAGGPMPGGGGMPVPGAEQPMPGPEGPMPNEGAHPLVQKMMQSQMGLQGAQALAQQPLQQNTRSDPYAMGRSGIIKLVGSIIAKKSAKNLANAEADFTRFLHEEVGPNPTWEAVHDFQAEHGISDAMLPESVRQIANHDLQLRQINAKHNSRVMADYQQILNRKEADIETLQIKAATDRETTLFEAGIDEESRQSDAFIEAKKMIRQGAIDKDVKDAALVTAWELEAFDARIESILRRNSPEGGAGYDISKARRSGGAIVDPVGALGSAGKAQGSFQGIMSMDPNAPAGAALTPAELTVEDRFPENAPGNPDRYSGIFALYAKGTGAAAGAARAEFNGALNQLSIQQGVPPAPHVQRRLNELGKDMVGRFGEAGEARFNGAVEELSAMRQVAPQTDEELRNLGVPTEVREVWRRPNVTQMGWWRNQIDMLEKGTISEVDWNAGSQLADPTVSQPFVGPPAPGGGPAGGAPAAPGAPGGGPAAAPAQASGDTVTQARQWVESAGGEAEVQAMLNDPTVSETQKDMIRQVLQMVAGR